MSELGMMNEMVMASGGMVELDGNSSACFDAVEADPNEENSRLDWAEGSQFAVGAVPSSGGGATGAVPVAGRVRSGGAASTPPVSGGGKVTAASAPKKSAETSGARLAAMACG